MSGPSEKLRKLESIERELASAMQSASTALTELSKEKPSMKQVESNASNFLKQLERVETEISQQIMYLTQVSTGQPHEGSSYASQKVLHMGWHRFEHARQRLNELERTKSKHQQQQQQQQQQHQQQHQQQQQQLQEQQQLQQSQS